MALTEFLIGALVVGATSFGIGSSIKKRNRNKRREQEERIESQKRQEEEEKRKNTPCYFEDGISEVEFHKIVKSTAKRFKRLKIISISGLSVEFDFYSQSGLTTYNAKINFNDYGHITGKYWWEKYAYSDSKLPTIFSEALKDNLCIALKDAETNYNKNVFPNHCKTCGNKIIGRPYWCMYCGAQIRKKRIWFCHKCGMVLNSQTNFNTDSGIWICTECNTRNRVKEYFY
ncbi:MAG: Sec23/Sec24 zinc finger-containing protein [Ruminococcus sp.]|nr:Sec23/Sec24 zinc finger-containing protein [Ruminococcus sp.]